MKDPSRVDVSGPLKPFAPGFADSASMCQQNPLHTVVRCEAIFGTAGNLPAALTVLVVGDDATIVDVAALLIENIAVRLF